MKLDYPFNGGQQRRRELMSLMVAPSQVTRSVMIDGQRKTISLETEIWDGFKEVARNNSRSIEEICREIYSQLPDGIPLASAIRVFVLNYYCNSSRNAELVS